MRSFQKNLLVSIGGIFLLFATCFSVYQYQREKEYKIDILHSRLLMYNYEMIQTLGEDSAVCYEPFRRYVERHNMEGLRVSIISKDGRVLQDSHDNKVDSLGNHLKRKEIQQALQQGSGYDIKRLSESTHETYFYSATRFGDIIVRAAVPYSAELTRSLQADNTFLYYAIVLTALLGLALYWSTRRISRHIGYLREFAYKAEKGQELDHELERHLPDDELGAISHTIIQLYWKLRHSEEEKVRIKRQLTQNAAHELKTPAASIHGYLESILEHPDLPEDKRQHFLERCFAQSERMNKLLSDMSALTKLDEMPLSIRSDVKTCSIDVVPIVHSVMEDVNLQMQESNVRVEYDMPHVIMVATPLGEAEGASAMYSIFRNLVDNVLSYAVGVSAIRINYHDGEFTFSDNGVGVPAEHLPYLFERFYRVDKGRSRKLGGTGLGLAIVKNAVAIHGGEVMAERTPGGGLTIRFRLSPKGKK